MAVGFSLQKGALGGRSSAPNMHRVTAERTWQSEMNFGIHPIKGMLETIHSLQTRRTPVCIVKCTAQHLARAAAATMDAMRAGALHDHPALRAALHQ